MSATLAAPDYDYFAGVDPDTLPPPDPALFEAARGLADGWQPVGCERRRVPRFVLAADALFRPVDTEGRPIGKPFRAVVADLSTDGLRFFHSRSVVARRLAVRLSLWATTVTAVVEVCRSAQAGGRFEYAGPFAAPLKLIDSDDIAAASVAASDL